MDPDGDYESRHSTRSAADDVNLAGADIDVDSPSKIFVPDEDTKLPAKPMKGGDAYEGATAPPMEGPPLVPDAAAAAAARSSIEPRGTAYDDMMSGKRDLAAPDEAPISNSVAVPIGFDSDYIALPEAKALPIISSTANEGTKMPSGTFEEVPLDDTEDTEEEPTSLNNVNQNQGTGITTPDTRDVSSMQGNKTSVSKCRRKWCTWILRSLPVIALVVIIAVFAPKNCLVDHPEDLGNGYCSSEYNTKACSWDGGDCTEFNAQYPDCHVEYPGKIGDGYCDGGKFNSAKCGWDGGDCELYNSLDHCSAVNPGLIGDGECNGGEYNTPTCGWDGGDCNAFNKKYPKCIVDETWMPVNDGFCQSDEKYNTAECGWDGGDCLFYSRSENCAGTIKSTWNDKTRAWCQFKCMDEGTSCKGYDYKWSTDKCRLYSTMSFMTTEDMVGTSCWKKKDSDLITSAIVTTEDADDSEQANGIIEIFGACFDGKTGDTDMQCIQGVLSTLDPEIIGKLAQCAGEVSVSAMQACVEEQLLGD